MRYVAFTTLRSIDVDLFLCIAKCNQYCISSSIESQSHLCDKKWSDCLSTHHYTPGHYCGDITVSDALISSYTSTHRLSHSGTYSHHLPICLRYSYTLIEQNGVRVLQTQWRCQLPWIPILTVLLANGAILIILPRYCRDITSLMDFCRRRLRCIFVSLVTIW